MKLIILQVLTLIKSILLFSKANISLNLYTDSQEIIQNVNKKVNAFIQFIFTTPHIVF